MKRRVVIVLSALFTMSLIEACHRQSHAHEWGNNEGRLRNDSSDVALCLWDDAQGNLCGSWVDQGSWCRGDAMFVNDFVFKVPNKTHWRCTDRYCYALNAYSDLRMDLARIKNGSDRYGKMSLSSFKTLMWDWSISMCINR